MTFYGQPCHWYFGLRFFLDLDHEDSDESVFLRVTGDSFENKSDDVHLSVN